MREGSIPAFNSPRASHYRRLYEQSLEKARGAGETVVRTELEGGVQSTVFLDKERVALHQPDGPVIDEYVHSLVLNDARNHSSRILRQNTNTVIKPGPGDSLMVMERAINYVSNGEGGETPRSTWTRVAQVIGDQVIDRMFYTSLGGRMSAL